MKVARIACALLAAGTIAFLAGCGADPAFTSGKVYLGQKDYDNAIEQLQIAIKNSPDAWQPHMYLGMAYADTDQLQMAHDELFTALDLAQDDKSKAEVENAINYYWLEYDKEGERLNEAAQFLDAIDQFEKAIVIDPRQADAYINLGYALHMSMNYDRAIEVFEQAMEYDSDNEILVANLISVYETKGGSLASLGDHEAALQYFEKIQRLDPDYPDINYNIGMMYYSAKDYNDALRYFHQHLELNEDDEEVLYRVFLAHWAIAKELEETGLEEAALEEHEEAVAPLEHLIDLNDTEVTYHRALARVYAKLGREDEAMHELNMVESLLRGEIPVREPEGETGAEAGEGTGEETTGEDTGGEGEAAGEGE
jgi:tetratricopeptide (TPR) repeat protein